MQEAEEASQELDKLLNAAAKEGKIKKVYKVSSEGCLPRPVLRVHVSSTSGADGGMQIDLHATFVHAAHRR